MVAQGRTDVVAVERVVDERRDVARAGARVVD